MAMVRLTSSFVAKDLAWGMEAEALHSSLPGGGGGGMQANMLQSPGQENQIG